MEDLAVSNNGDTEKVLATVVSALYAFFDKHPDTFLYATASTAARTRLYRIGISKYFEEMTADFQLYGQIGDDFYKYENGKEYDGFLAQEKLIKLNIMKTLKDLNNKKVPLVRIDPTLNKFRDNTPFPEKPEKANAALKTEKLPQKKHRS